jgi:hypothetical protein
VDLYRLQLERLANGCGASAAQRLVAELEQFRKAEGVSRWSAIIRRAASSPRSVAPSGSMPSSPIARREGRAG